MKSLLSYVKENCDKKPHKMVNEACAVKPKNPMEYEGCQIWKSESGDWCVIINGRKHWGPHYIADTLEEAKLFAKTKSYDVMPAK